MELTGHHENCPHKPEQNWIFLVRELVDTQQQFITLLSEELDEISVLAANHGWRSSRVRESFILKNKINALNSSLKIWNLTSDVNPKTATTDVAASGATTY